MSIRGDRNAATRQPQQPILEARVGEHISWSHLAIVGAIVHGVSVSVNLVEAAWEQHRAVEARIEGAQVVNVGVVHLDAAQCFVPGFSALF